MLNTTLNFVYFFGFLSCAWLGQKDSTFWSVTQSLLMGEQVAIQSGPDVRSAVLSKKN